MKIDRLVLGAFEANCYVVRENEQTADCLVIDPGLDESKLIAFLQNNHLNPKSVVLSHGHVDHIAGLNAIRETYSAVRVYIHRLDAGFLEDSGANLSILAGIHFKAAPAEMLLDDRSEIHEAGLTFTVLHTPGHTPGGICLYSERERILISGDTLFADSIGRADFPGGNGAQLLRSIHDQLLILPDDTVVYPGHGMRTTIGRERKSNPFLTAQS